MDVIVSYPNFHKAVKLSMVMLRDCEKGAVMRWYCGGFVACVFCCTQVFGQAGDGGIRGTILDATTLKPVPAAIVVAIREGVPSFSRNTKSGGDGAFDIQGLSPGNYTLCVQAQGDQYLDPCQWGGESPTVTIDPSVITSGVSVKLRTASVVNIEVADPQKLVGRIIAGGRRSDLSVGVWSAKGLFYPARHFTTPGSLEGTSHTYRIPVPRDISLTLQVFSRDLRLGDSKGVVLPPQANRPAFQLATGDRNPKNFAFTVMGLLPQ